MAVWIRERGHAALAAFAELGSAAARGATLEEAADAIVRAAAAATGAQVAVARIIEESGQLRVRSVAAASLALAAELEGSVLPPRAVPAHETDELPLPLERFAARVGLPFGLLVPVRLEGAAVATLELLRSERPFGEDDRRLARLATAQLALALRAFGVGGRRRRPRPEQLEIAGEALAAGADEERVSAEVVRIASDATAAAACLLWLADEGSRPTLLAATVDEPPGMVELAERTLHGREPVAIERARVPDVADGVSVALQLGQPPVGVLQLLYDGPGPGADAVASLSRFSVRAAQALRAGRRAREVSQELDRTRALLQIVGQAISQLSLAHTLTTAIERVGDLLGIEGVCIYLMDGQRLLPAAGQAVRGRHTDVAERLLELVIGRYRARGLLIIDNAEYDGRLAGIEEALADAGIEAVLAMPLHVREETIGLLAAYPPRGRAFEASELALVSTLASQLAVAVQNAQLHEQAKQLGSELEQALQSERQAARLLRGLYEISRSFAQTLSLEATLDAVAQTLVEALEVDAAVIRMPDPRSESQVLQAIHVADVLLEPAVRTIFARVERTSLQRQPPLLEPVRLDTQSARKLGGSYASLVPFLEKGSSAVVLPIATPAEVLAVLTLVSFDRVRPIDKATLDLARTIAGQAALAIDNARLYQQQKQFADMMQRSLLPRALPEAEELELGDVYESSARVDVGGDVYDYLVLDDGRLAVVLGDVTGHGIDAAADMAMAKFVFRSLAREHPEPGDFLAHANDVVMGEIALGKFITMAYLVFDGRAGVVKCASAGHPAPRLVRPDGTVSGLEATGLALGIDTSQEYEELEAPLEPGAAVVLYTDGVIEARNGGGLYGLERLDAVLRDRRDAPAQELAEAVLEDCRRFGGGELADDCAIVVIKRRG